MAKAQWQWQEPGKAWNGVGIYHLILVVPSREPLLGELKIPEDDPTQAYIERSELGKAVIHDLAQKDQAGGCKTFKSWLWKVEGEAYDEALNG